MPKLDVGDGIKINYEVHGEGEPVLFLGGIMMNTMSWAAFVPVLSRKFKLILMDFRDQGQSSKMTKPYKIDIHVGDVIKLLDELAIPKVHLWAYRTAVTSPCCSHPGTRTGSRR